MGKSQAKDRTIDLFSGKTKEEEIAVALEDIQEPVGAKEPETIEQASERWRERCFQTSEYLSKRFGKEAIDGGSYRLTVRGGQMLLEQFRHTESGKGAYGWTGIMFPETDLYDITSVFVKAAKELSKRWADEAKAKEKN